MMGILLGMFGFSSAIQLFKNNMANSYIQRKGKVIHDDERSFSEIISNFIKSYAYLIVPGLNVYKAIKLFIENDASYAMKRLNYLKDCERITDAKDENTQTKEQVQAPTRTVHEVKNAQEHTSRKVKEIKKSPASSNLSNLNVSTIEEMNNIINLISISNSIDELESCKSNMRSRRADLANEYNNPTCSPERKHEIVRRVNIYDSIFISARDRANELRRKPRMLQ